MALPPSMVNSVFYPLNHYLNKVTFCLIPPSSAAVFMVCFIPLCSPTTFLNTHCPVTESYGIQPPSHIFYFRSATESILSSLLRWLPAALIAVVISKGLGIRWGKGLNQEEIFCHTFPRGIWHLATKERSKVKQKKICIVNICWLASFVRRFCRSGCNVFSSILLKATGAPGYKFRSPLEHPAATTAGVLNRAVEAEWHHRSLINQNKPLWPWLLCSERKQIHSFPNDKWILRGALPFLYSSTYRDWSSVSSEQVILGFLCDSCDSGSFSGSDVLSFAFFSPFWLT